jgi:ATP-dependent RNA helicase DDX3X
MVAISQTGTHHTSPSPSSSFANFMTGSGKTCAYLVPVLSRLMGRATRLRGPRPDLSKDYNPRNAVRAEPLVVIVVPARELAIQIFDDCRRLCYRSMLRPCVAYGGFPMRAQIEDLGKGCDILIATPGRLVALMDKPEVLTMARVKYTIIDEADEMVDQDWTDEMDKIMRGGGTLTALTCFDTFNLD